MARERLSSHSHAEGFCSDCAMAGVSREDKARWQIMVNGAATSLRRPENVVDFRQKKKEEDWAPIQLPNNVILFPLRQRFNYDCGRTILDVVGSKTDELPEEELTVRHVLNSLSTNERITPLGIAVGQNQEVMPAGVLEARLVTTRNGKDNHWVLVVPDQETIICPSKGVLRGPERMEEYNQRALVTISFTINPAATSINLEDYQQSAAPTPIFKHPRLAA